MKFKPDQEKIDIASNKAGVNFANREIFTNGYKTLLLKRFG